MNTKIILLLIISNIFFCKALNNNEKSCEVSSNIDKFYREFGINLDKELNKYEKHLFKKISNWIAENELISENLPIEFADDYLVESIIEKIDEIYDDYLESEMCLSKDFISNIIISNFQHYRMNLVIFLENKSLKYYLLGEISFDEYKKIISSIDEDKIDEFYIVNSRYVFDWIFNYKN
jgi:hypothetical protein